MYLPTICFTRNWWPKWPVICFLINERFSRCWWWWNNGWKSPKPQSWEAIFWSSCLLLKCEVWQPSIKMWGDTDSWGDWLQTTRSIKCLTVALLPQIRLVLSKKNCTHIITGQGYITCKIFFREYSIIKGACYNGEFILNLVIWQKKPIIISELHENVSLIFFGNPTLSLLLPSTKKWLLRVWWMPNPNRIGITRWIYTAFNSILGSKISTKPSTSSSQISILTLRSTTYLLTASCWGCCFY